MQLIYVLGLGETLSNYKPSNVPTIGVNDICTKIKTDYLVIQDLPITFDWDRYLSIVNHPPKKQVFSQHSVYADKFQQFTQLRVVPYQFSLLDESIEKFNRWEVPCSIDSSFLACVISYKLGYKNIITHGVDFGNHPELIKRLPVILNSYDILSMKLKKKGVNIYCSSKDSKLSNVLPVKSNL